MKHHVQFHGFPKLLLDALVLSGVCGLILTSQVQANENELPALSGLQKTEVSQLEAARGGADTTNNTVLNEIHASGTVSNNQAYNLNTGTNSIAGGAFSGANGLSTVVQNSGNNVLIQNSTIINIQFQ